MNPMLRACAGTVLALSLLAGGCANNKKKQSETELSDFVVSGIAVLPAAKAADADGHSALQEKSLEEGIHALDKALKEYFGGRADVRLVSDGQGSGKMDSSLKPLDQEKAVAERLSCNAVLETKLYRYDERIGGKYAAKEPASVAFDYRLLAMPDGKVLCMGRFDEKQQSLMENLLKFKLSAENAFTWITADRLLAQGLRDRLNSCPQLEKQ